MASKNIYYSGYTGFVLHTTGIEVLSQLKIIYSIPSRHVECIVLIKRAESRMG